jgi:hypothetical protein
LKTASGKKRETQTIKASSGGVSGTIGKPKGLKPGTIKPKSAPKSAPKPAPSAKTNKTPNNPAKRRYKAATSKARSMGADLKGASAAERRQANTAAASVRNMQRRRSTSLPKAAADSPKAKQQAKQTARLKRAVANERRAYDRFDKQGATAKGSRTASVAKRARDIYSGKISPSYKTTSRLTRTQDPQVLRDRIKRSEKLTAAQQQVNAAPTASRQKQKWAAAAEKRRAQADRAEANAKRLRDANRRVGDTAFWTQPGLGKQRDKARAGLEKSFREQERAKALRSKANNLERMSKTTKGAAASRQQSRRDAFDAKKIKKGDTVNSILYGQVKVLRVNKKTVTISVNGGKPFTEDKSRFSI